MRRWPKQIRTEVIKLRIEGKSFSEIVAKTQVPKSTISLWLKDTAKPNHLAFINRAEWLSQIRVLAIKRNHDKRTLSLDKIKKEVTKDIDTWLHVTSTETKKTILAFLYWAEGSKGREVVTFANTDPRLAFLFITLLRSCFSLDESKFRIRLHLHDYHDESRVKAYWSNLLGVPPEQFHKTQFRSAGVEKTFRKNIGGICFIKYNSVYLQERITQYSLQIAEKLTGKLPLPEV